MLRNLCELSRDELQAEYRRLTTYLQQIHRLSPAYFRNRIRLPNDKRPDGERQNCERPIVEHLADWQLADFQALDASWKRVVTHDGRQAQRELDGHDDEHQDAAEVIAKSSNGKAPFRRAWIERPRGHSKTSDTAIMVAWALVAADNAISGLAAAVDKEQARLLKDAIARLIESNPNRLAELKVTDDFIRNKVTGSTLRIISSDAASSYGELVDFILCDELCHWSQPDLWYSLLSTAAKKEHCLLMVLTNAGTGLGWQWQAREQARTSDSWHFSTLQGPQAPWITAASLEEQKASLPEPVFRRLWLNEWQHSDGEFVSLDEAEACRDESLTIVEAGDKDVCYVAAIDYAEKHDYTAAVIAHHDGSRVVIDRLDVAVPDEFRMVPVQWVEDWLERYATKFPNLTVWVDEYQLVSVIQKWRPHLLIDRFNFRNGQGNHQLARALQQAILNQTVAWPAGCGAIETVDAGRDDLETELASLRFYETRNGYVRFDHRNRLHDDRSFVVAVACLKLMETQGPEWLTLDDGWLP